MRDYAKAATPLLSEMTAGRSGVVLGRLVERANEKSA
jgi:hypothetical protein